jgi:threonine/homoserine/homoserine lactone efflux protein
MFLLGCGVRLLDDVMDVRGNPHSIFLFLLLFPTLVKQENDWIGMLASTPGTLLVWFVAIYLTFRKREQSSPDRSWRAPA